MNSQVISITHIMSELPTCDSEVAHSELEGEVDGIPIVTVTVEADYNGTSA